jgi:hypothetical protein
MPPRRSSMKGSPKKLAARMKRRWRVVLLRPRLRLLDAELRSDEAIRLQVAARDRPWHWSGVRSASPLCW